MKILFLTSRYPFPPVGGDKLRAYHFLKYLSSRGHKVHLFSLIDHPIKFNDIITDEIIYFLPKSESYLKCLRGLFSFIPLQVWYYQSKKFRCKINNAIAENNYDMIFCHLLRTTEYVKAIKHIPKIVDLTDAISLNYSRIVENFWENISFKKIIYAIESKRVLYYEGQILDSFDKSILISQNDKKYLGQFYDVSNVEIIPNGVDLEYFSYFNGEYNRNRIVFMGNMRTVPNIDAALYFAHEIFPLIKKKIPKAEFFIVGVEPIKKIYKLASKDKNISVTGFVDDIRQYLKTAAVSVAPMRYGAGIQNKILESMAIGTPVVTTSTGLEGINAIHGKEIMVEDLPEMFASRIVDLIQDSKLRESISVSGRVFIEKHYSWEKNLEKLNFLINDLKKC